MLSLLIVSLWSFKKEGITFVRMTNNYDGINSLPHVHMLLILGRDDKIQDPDDVDKIVRAELPDQTNEKELYDIVRILF